MAQQYACFGEKQDILVGRTTPHVKVKLGDLEGYFLIDYGTTKSTIDPQNFINGKPAPQTNTTNKFENFGFIGSWGTVSLTQQDYSRYQSIGNNKQAGIIGTDFLTVNIYTIDYNTNKVFRAKQNSFCTDQFLMQEGFKAVSTIGFFANDYAKVQSGFPNVPTIPIKIGNIVGMTQIDTGYDDFRYRHSININQSFFTALKEAGINLIETPEKNINLTTCAPNVIEPILAYSLPSGIYLSIIGIDGNPVLVTSECHIFLKKTPVEAKSCGGIGTWQIPAAQMGASFLQDAKKVIFDPFKSRVWFMTK